MSKKTLLAKRVLTALALGSVLYAPMAMAGESAANVNPNDNKFVLIALSDIGVLPEMHYLLCNGDVPVKTDGVWQGKDVFVASDLSGGNSGNMVTITPVDGKNINPDVYGAYVETGRVEKNTVRIFDSKVVGDICGAYTGNGEVWSNSVMLVGGELKANAYGGKIGEGNIRDNTIVLMDIDLTNSDAVLQANTVAIPANSLGNIEGIRVLIDGDVSPDGKSNYNVVYDSGSEFSFSNRLAKNTGVTGNGISVIDGSSEYSISGVGIEGTGTNVSASRNYVYIGAKGSTSKDIVGAYTQFATADRNMAVVKGGWVGGQVFAGKTSAGGNAIGNMAWILDKAQVKNNQQAEYAVFAGWSTAGSTNYNELIVRDSTVLGGVVAGTTDVGNAVGNTVEINKSANVQGNVVSGRGRLASENSVSVIGESTVNGDVIGGKTYDGSATDNEVFVDGSSVGGGDLGIIGGRGEHGTVTGNNVSINNSSAMARIYGGFAVTGTVNDNSVTVADSFVRGPLYGGYSQSGDVGGNSLTLLDGKYVAGVNVQGQVRYAGGFSEGGQVSGNTVVLGADAFVPKLYDSAWVIGGASKDADDKSEGAVSGNSITIYNAEFNLVEDGEDVVQRYTHIVAGRGGDGDVTNNSLVIKDITLNAKIGEGDDYKNNVWGGFAQNEGNVSGNSITVEKGILNINLMAGGSSNLGAATNNTVTITGKDTVINGGTIFGGRCYKGEGEVSGNVVDISDATIKANVSGGWTTMENKAHDNKVFLNAVTVGSSAEETYSINASKDNKESKGGLVQVKSGGLLNNANLTLGGGKVKIDGNITGAGNLTINSNTGEINASVTQTSLTFGKEGNTTNTVTASMDNIHVTTLTNHGTFNVSGTLNQEINGNGTNKVLENTTLSLGTDASMSNLALIGTLNLQNKNIDAVSFDSFTAESGSKLNFEAKFSTEGDQISATSGSGTFALGSVGLEEGFEGDVGTTAIYTLLTEGAADIVITGSAETVVGVYKYVFTPGTVAGTLNVMKDNGYSLVDVINDRVDDHVAGQVSNYSLRDNMTMSENMGTLTRSDSQVVREFTINGNSHKLLGNGKLGITVNSGDTLTYKDIAEVSGFNGAAVTNNGTFNANNVTFKNEVAGNGTMIVDGTVNADAKVSNKMNIAGTGTLNIVGANVGNTVANAGIFNFLGGNLNYAVTGNGTMNIKADTQFGAKVSNNVVVEESKKLTTDVNFVDGSVDVKGSIDLSGTGTINHELGGRGELMVLKGAVVTFEDVVTGHMTNSGTINFVNGSSYVGNMSSVPNSGSTTNVTGTVNVGGSVISRNINVTDATIVGDTQKTNNRIGGVVTTIIGSTLTDIAVCGIVHSSDDHNASGNKVIVTDSTVGNVYGGNTVRFNFGDKDAKNNIVTISNSVVGGDVIGGYTATGDSEGNTVTLDKVTLTKDRHYVWANMTDSNSQVADDGTVIIGSQGIVNDGETNLGGGKVQIDGNVTGSGNLTISSNTGEINASVTQNSLTIGKEGNTTNTLTASMDNIHVTALTNHGTFNVSGTLNQAINGNGTNKVLENTTLSMGADASMNNLTLAGTLNLQNDAYETTTIANLTANAGAKVNFDAKFSAAGDQISATTGSGTLALGSIGLKEDFDGDVGASTIYTLLTNGATNITLTGSSEAVMGAYKYVFIVGETAGTLTVTKDYGYELTEIIQDSAAGHVAGQVSNYSLNGDKTMDADMGTLTRPDSKVAREFTINGNSHKLLGNGKLGITVNSGDTLTYKDIAEVSGFNGAAVTNNGTFNANNVTFKNEIAGSGTMNIDGIVNADAKVSNKMNIVGSGTLNIAGANVANTVANAGTFNFLGGNLNYAVTGVGTTNVKGDTTLNAKVSNNVVVEESKKLTVIDSITVESITLQNAVLDVNEGKVLAINNLTMTGASATVTMDKANVLNDDLSVKDGWGNIIVGTDGNLNLRFEGIGYTVNQYKSIKSGLFGQGENASLNLLGGNLQLEENQVLVVKGATVDDGKGNMTIGGAKPAVSTNGDEGTEVGAQANQTIVIARANQLGSLNSVAVNANSNIVAKDLKIENIDKDSFRLTVGGGSGDSSILELTGTEDGLIKDENGKEVAIDVTISSGSTFNIGNKDKGQGKNNGNGQLKALVVDGDVNVYNMGLNIVTLTIGKDGCITFDPGYYAVGDLEFNDGGVARVLTDGTVLNVDNMDVEKLEKAVETAGMNVTEQSKGFTVADGYAVLALKKQLNLTGSKHLVVDVAGTPATYALRLGAGAVLVAQKEETPKDTPVVKVDNAGVVSIDKKAQLVISADKYQDEDKNFISYVVLGDDTDSFDNLWNPEGIFAADPTFTFKYDEIAKKLVADWNKVEGIFGEDAISAPEMYNRILQKEQNTDANKFLKDVINKNASAGSTAATKAAGAAALNAVTSLGELAAVNHGLYTVSNQMTDAVANHMSLIDNEEASRDIWAAYIHNKEDVEELKLGGIDADYSAKYNGVVVGADLAKSDKGNVGVALSYVDGDISGASAGVRTRNDAEYYGASLYGRLDGKDVSLLGDISYMHGKGDITQNAMGQEITADTKSDAISVGLRLEKAFKLGKVGKLMPYAAVRYLQISTKNYKNNLGMNYDMDDQNLFMAPVGIVYSAHIVDNGWTYKPTFEAGYVFNMGDKSVDQKVSYNGYGDTFGMDIVDDGYWFGRFGFTAESKHVAYSLGYQYMKSKKAKNNKYMVNAAWKF